MEDQRKILVSSLYMGPASYFGLFAGNEEVLIEQHDHYTKQTYRNRCVILAANGPLNLVIPVQKHHGQKTKMKDVRIDYATNWQRLHLTGIRSAYQSSAFFEFYFDEIEPFYLKKTTFLIDLNTRLTSILLKASGLPGSFTMTDHYFLPEKTGKDTLDMRDVIHPKKEISSAYYQDEAYHQVFSVKFGFVPGLSLIDLLFNAGPETGKIIRSGLKMNRPDRRVS